MAFHRADTFHAPEIPWCRPFALPARCELTTAPGLYLAEVLGHEMHRLIRVGWLSQVGEFAVLDSEPYALPLHPSQYAIVRAWPEVGV